MIPASAFDDPRMEISAGVLAGGDAIGTARVVSDARGGVDRARRRGRDAGTRTWRPPLQSRRARRLLGNQSRPRQPRHRSDPLHPRGDGRGSRRWCRCPPITSLSGARSTSTCSTPPRPTAAWGRSASDGCGTTIGSPRVGGSSITPSSNRERSVGYHRHDTVQECYLILAGDGVMKVDGTVFDVDSGYGCPQPTRRRPRHRRPGRDGRVHQHRLVHRGSLRRRRSRRRPVGLLVILDDWCRPAAGVAELGGDSRPQVRSRCASRPGAWWAG